MRSMEREVQGEGPAKGKTQGQARQESRRSGIRSFQDSSCADTRLFRLQRAGIFLGFDGPDSLPRRFCYCRRARAAGRRAVGGAGLTCGGGASSRPAPRRSCRRLKTRGAAGSRGACAVCGTRLCVLRQSGSRSRPRSGGPPPSAGREFRGPRGWGRGRRVRVGPRAPLGALAWRRGRDLGPLGAPCPALGLPWGLEAQLGPRPLPQAEVNRSEDGAGPGEREGALVTAWRGKRGARGGAGLGQDGRPGVRCVV